MATVINVVIIPLLPLLASYSLKHKATLINKQYPFSNGNSHMYEHITTSVVIIS